MEPIDRVFIWNSYFCEARSFARKLKTAKTLECQDLEGKTLSSEKHYALMTMLLLALAIEARANHLIFWLVEEYKIDEKTGNNLMSNKYTTKDRWQKLPTCIGKNKISFTDKPHDAIEAIYELRNRFVHLRYQDREFISEIPDYDKTIEYYNSFVLAMQNMNVILEREEQGEDYVKKLMV